MRHTSLIGVFGLGLAACSSGSGELGDRCGGQGDCSSSLQCLGSVCVPRCQRAPECGDGYACDKAGICQAATGQVGNICTSEVDCAVGLACELDGTDPAGNLLASCAAETAGRPAAAQCILDDDCRNGTCALGHCVDLCRDTSDCGAGTSCTQIPRVEAPNAPMFAGCLQSHGALRWALPVHGPSDHVLLPLPDSARSVSVAFSVEDPNQRVGAAAVTSPSGAVLVDPTQSYYANPVRHRLELGQSVLAMPSSPTTPLEPGAYTLWVVSQRSDLPIPGTATPTATAVIKLDASVILDLHFYFLDFDDHPCAQAFGGALGAQIAQAATFFQDDFLGTMRSVFAHGGVALGTLTYEDVLDHPELDGLDVANAGSLLALGAHDVGINVFFVRTLSPVGLQAFGPIPGPAGLAGTSRSGIVVGLDTLCYRTWSQLARLASHELAHYMGLYDNVELGFDQDPRRQDPIPDSDTSSTNLMFYSELGGGDLSPGQRDILSRSAVLR